ncbi:MAG: type I-U CRISPR-associated protein Csb2 [Candidatus Binatia bacterium]|nr:type I-U CRISPR-associated protein Csb2 [Candidatus Binatia bacterium]
MRIVLRQVFPLGRFHATPWRVNPFDDPHGEWPPSPWRFARAVVARWYQWARESKDPRSDGELDKLVRALCTSSYAFWLSPAARRGAPLRQYFPADFDWDPAVKGKPGMRSYRRSLAQDNYWCTLRGDEGAVWWFIDGPDWSDELATVLDRCLERMIYFGRAESFSRMYRESVSFPQPNCELFEEPRGDRVPVLVPSPEARRSDLERTTEDPSVAGRSLPPGARYLYAARPPRPFTSEKRQLRSMHSSRNLIQFAIGWTVQPELRAVARLTSRFRGRVLRELLKEKANGRAVTWSRASRELRNAVALIAGKDADGKPLQGHRHAEFFVWCEDGCPTRLMVWRSSTFEREEEQAILAAAAQPVSWAAPGDDSDAWKVRLVPLDRSVPPPPGFGDGAWQVWESMVPYVPARRYLRGGKLRAREAVEHQVRRELALRGVAGAEQTNVEVLGSSWVAVHLPRVEARARTSWGDRRGYRLRLEFPEPVPGPLRLGHSASFGVGLFKPVA